MKPSFFFLVAFLLVLFSSCEKISGDGPVITQNRTIINFSGVDLRCSAEVIFQQDNNYKVEVNAQQNILDVLITEVVNDRLVIRFKNDVRVRSHEPIRVVVSAPSLNRLRISGSGSINTAGQVTTTTMEMDISGSGSILMPQLYTGFLDANISGSGNIRVLGGTATEEKLRISGSGDIYLTDVLADKVTTTTSGSGDTRVQVAQVLNVSISGSGSVYYKGNPSVNVSVSGSGKVVRW